MRESERPADSKLPGEHVGDVLEELRSAISDGCRGSIRECGFYGCALRAALAKSFEFATLANKENSPSYGFFTTSTLRGICEDLIVFTFLEALNDEDRNESIALLMASNVREGIHAQSEFFRDERPWQPVLQPSKKDVLDAEQALRKLSKKLGWNGRQVWPTVWFMAKTSSLTSLYNYLYSATSKSVHFSPHVLLRMGWGGAPDDVDDQTEWSFTTTHFAQYYAEFNQIYSILLLIRLLRGPAAGLLPVSVDDAIARLRTHLDRPLRWPEAVTFEEMNRRAPGSLSRILMRAAYDREGDGQK